MANTTEEKLYRGILRDLRNGLDLDESRIYIAIDAFQDSRFDECVQIIPDVPQSQHPISGVGLVETQFKVVCWKRVALDVAQEGTERLINETFGLINRCSKVQTILIQGLADDNAKIPITYIRSEKQTEPKEGFIWCQRGDTFNVGFMRDWRRE